MKPIVQAFMVLMFALFPGMCRSLWADDAMSAVFARQVREQILSLPREMRFEALTLPSKTPVSVHLKIGAPELDAPSVVAIPGKNPGEMLHEYHDMIQLAPGSYVQVGDETLRLNCAWVQASDFTLGAKTLSRFLWVYLAVNADGSARCVGPVKRQESYDNDAWSAHLKLIFHGTFIRAPAKASVKYGGVEYDLQARE